MDIGRRQLLFGGAFAGLAAVSGPAQACLREADNPFSRRFWARRLDLWFAMPRREQRLIRNLLEGVMEGARDKIDRVLAPDAVMFVAPDGTAHWTRPPRRFDRAQALAYLTDFTRMTGARNCRIHHQDALSPHSEFIVDATIYGNGQPRPVAGADAVPAIGWSICGEPVTDAWSRRMIFTLRTLNSSYRDPHELQLTSLVLLSP
jgi:hypothetical protein